MHTEGEIRSVIKSMVEFFGQMTTSEVKAMVGEYLEFDDEDLEMSNTRNEIKIIQRIGNIVSHQKEKVRIYDEGFCVDKTSSPAIFLPIEGLGNQKHPISRDISMKRKEESQKLVETKGKQIDWDYIHERNTSLGRAGEEFVYAREQERVKSIDPSSVDRVIHLSAVQGDGFGYDIASVDEHGVTTYIEVKTTTGAKTVPFYMSINERNFFLNNINKNVFLYRVYDFNENTRHGKVAVISAQELFRDYQFDPVNYCVEKK